MSKPKSVKIKHSFASYKEGPDSFTSLPGVARALLKWGNIPRHLNDTRAFELALLAQDYLRLIKTKEGV